MWFIHRTRTHLTFKRRFLGWCGGLRGGRVVRQEPDDLGQIHFRIPRVCQPPIAEPKLSARPGAAALLSTDPVNTAVLPVPLASTLPVSARCSGGGQNPSPDDSDPGFGP